MIVGRYSLDEEIGRGGMGAVWRGRDETLGRVVAIKRVGAVPGGSTPDVLRAEREARLGAQLNHQHVVAVFDLVEDGDQHWLVMEYVEGTNLAELVRSNGALSPDEIAPLLRQAADALAAAHSAGIVHRDVKPSNLLVTADGEVKITDFGIARTEADAALTQTGLVTGSPAYLAPEVASGQLATPTSDVWSLGATLYHALTGRPPYEVGDNVLGTLYRIVHEEPPRPPASGWLAPLVEATMSVDPAGRWSAAEVRDFLEAGPSASPVRAVPPPPPVAAVPVAAQPQGTQVLPSVERPASPGDRRMPWVWVGLTVAIVLVVSLVAFAIGTSNGDDAEPSAGPSGTSSASADAPGAEPTAEEMEAFVATYLDTVVDDPEAAFEMLTAGFQEESGGLKGYLGFWGDVNRTELQSVDADPDSLVVEYTYRYHKPGGRPVDDDVALQLEYDDGTYLIAGEA